MKKVLKVVAIIAGILLIGAVALVIVLMNIVYAPKTIVVNDSSEKVRLSAYTYCYECSPGEYDKKSLGSIASDSEAKFSVYWDDEHFDVPVFSRKNAEGDVYLCGKVSVDEKGRMGVFRVSEMSVLEARTVEEAGEECNGLRK